MASSVELESRRGRHNTSSSNYGFLPTQLREASISCSGPTLLPLLPFGGWGARFFMRETRTSVRVQQKRESEFLLQPHQPSQCSLLRLLITRLLRGAHLLILAVALVQVAYL